MIAEMAEHYKQHSLMGVALPNLTWGIVNVVTPNGSVGFLCQADGTVDCRDRIVEIRDFALANLPAKVSFGAGDFGLSGGIRWSVPAGERGLTIEADPAVTRFIFMGDTSIPQAGEQFIAFAIEPDVIPAYGDYANYIDDIHVAGLHCKDNDPFLHQYHSDEFTGVDVGAGNAAFLTVSGTPFVAGALVGQYIRNETDKSLGVVTANTTNTVTAVLYAGTDNDWDNGDEYSISALVEETHAVSIKYALTATIDNPVADSIGDEAYNFTAVVNGTMNDPRSTNTPAVGGGSVVSIQTACKSIEINSPVFYGSTVHGTRSGVTKGGGVAIELIGSGAKGVADIDTVVINNPIIRDFEADGILSNNASTAGVPAEIIDLVINNPTVKNCGKGLAFLGNNPHRMTILSGGSISDVDEAVDADLALANVTGFIVNGTAISDVAVRGMTIGGTGADIRANFKDCAGEAVYVSDASGVKIGGTMDACGGAATPVIDAIATGKKVTITAVITNANSTTQVIRNCETVEGGSIEQTAPYYQQISQVRKVHGLTHNGGAEFEAVAAPQYTSNHLDCGGALLASHAVTFDASNDNFICSDNYINTYNGSTLRWAINVNAGGDNGMIANNIVITDTPGSGINNAGTGNTLDNNKDL